MESPLVVRSPLDEPTKRASLIAATLALLDSFQPADERGSVHWKRFYELARSQDDPFDRERLRAHITASAFVLAPSLEQVLMIHHRKLGFWLQPGGHAEPCDPHPAAIASRETQEETGVKELLLPPWAPALLDIDIHDIPARQEMPAHEHFDLRFLFVAPRPEQLLADPRETLGLAWVPLDGGESYPTDASVLRTLRKIKVLLSARVESRRGPSAS